MNRDQNRRHRRCLRLKTYDYSQAGAYFVTITIQNRLCLLGEVRAGVMVLSPAGRLVSDGWEALPTQFAGVTLDAFVVMPNHLHGILILGGEKGIMLDNGPTLGDVICGFKSSVTIAYGCRVRNLGWPPYRRRLWQRNYYEHVIRSRASLERVRRYIADNPFKWTLDSENPNAAPGCD